jgi:hypothetical protein
MVTAEGMTMTVTDKNIMVIASMSNHATRQTCARNELGAL